MFNDLFYRRRERMRRMLATRVNKGVMDRLNDGDRSFTRTASCEVVWVVPYNENDRSDFEGATTAVTRDVSTHGIGLIHNGDLEAEFVLVGMEVEKGREFVRCRVHHSTSIGSGYFHIGLEPERIVSVSRRIQEEIQERLGESTAFANIESD